MLSTYLKYSFKFLGMNLIMSFIAVLQIAVSVLLLNFSLGSVRGTCMQLIYAAGLRDDSLYLVQPTATLINEGGRSLSEQETTLLFEKLINGYCTEQGIAIPEKGSEDYFVLLNTYDCMIRYYMEHLEELGDSTNFYLHDDMAAILNEISEGFEDYGTYDFLFPATELNGITLNGFTVIDEEIAEDIYLHLAKGKQLSNLTNTENVIEAIAYGDDNLTELFHIGDETEVQLYNYEKHEYETYTVRIAGILDTPFFLMDCYQTFSGEETIDLDWIISRNGTSDYSGYASLLILPFEGFSPKAYHAGYSPQRYFVNTANVDFDISEFENRLTAAGYEVANAGTAWQNSFNTIFSSIVSYAILLMISTAMTFLTLFGVSVLHVNNNWKTHHILQISGAAYRDHVHISLLLLTHLLTIGTAIGGLVIYLYEQYQNSLENSEYFGIILDEYNVYFTAVLLFFFVVVFYGILRFLFRKMKEE